VGAVSVLMLVFSCGGGNGAAASDVAPGADARQDPGGSEAGPRAPVPLDLVFVVSRNPNAAEELLALAEVADLMQAWTLAHQSAIDLKASAILVSDDSTLGFRQDPPGSAPLGPGCQGAEECCHLLCHNVECGLDESCIQQRCAEGEPESCPLACEPVPEDRGAQHCSLNEEVLLCSEAGSLSDWFRCRACEAQGNLPMSVTMEQAFRAAWESLRPTSTTAGSVASALREDAYLLIAFVSNRDDCTLDEQFAAPTATCLTDTDCGSPYSKCVLDVRMSQILGKESKLCTGQILLDYVRDCPVLGEYKGKTHHACAYDLECADCATDADCDYGWHCENGRKCRPFMFGLGVCSSYQVPAGAPVFSLAPVAEYYARFRSLKDDPGKVLVAVIAGDTVTSEPGRGGVSPACLASSSIPSCEEYSTLDATQRSECESQPDQAQCAEAEALMVQCMRDCFVTTNWPPDGKVQTTEPMCSGKTGAADLGSRYIALAKMFGPNGLTGNVCTPTDYLAVLTMGVNRVLERASGRQRVGSAP